MAFNPWSFVEGLEIARARNLEEERLLQDLELRRSAEERAKLKAASDLALQQQKMDMTREAFPVVQEMRNLLLQSMRDAAGDRQRNEQALAILSSNINPDNTFNQAAIANSPAFLSADPRVRLMVRGVLDKQQEQIRKNAIAAATRFANAGMAAAMVKELEKGGVPLPEGMRTIGDRVFLGDQALTNDQVVAMLVNGGYLKDQRELMAKTPAAMPVAQVPAVGIPGASVGMPQTATPQMAPTGQPIDTGVAVAERALNAGRVEQEEMAKIADQIIAQMKAIESVDPNYQNNPTWQKLRASYAQAVAQYASVVGTNLALTRKVGRTPREVMGLPEAERLDYDRKEALRFTPGSTTPSSPVPSAPSTSALAVPDRASRIAGLRQQLEATRQRLALATNPSMRQMLQQQEAFLLQQIRAAGG